MSGVHAAQRRRMRTDKHSVTVTARTAVTVGFHATTPSVLSAQRTMITHPSFTLLNLRSTIIAAPACKVRIYHGVSGY